jgi:hypothetical protein
MLQLVTGVLIGVIAVIVVRRLVGIRQAPWVTTLLAVLVANAAVIEVLRLVYGNLGEVPGRAVLGAGALVTVFAVLGVLLVEALEAAGMETPRQASTSVQGGPRCGRADRPLRASWKDLDPSGARAWRRRWRRRRVPPGQVATIVVRRHRWSVREARPGDGAAATTGDARRRGGAGASPRERRACRPRSGASRHRSRRRTRGGSLRRICLRAPRGGLDRADVSRPTARRPGGRREGAAFPVSPRRSSATWTSSSVLRIASIGGRHGHDRSASRSS